MVTKKERISYGMYFLGQNIFYMLILSYMNTYFTDVGISALAVGGLALVVKVWDAVNDPLFGGLIDKIRFKKGKFLPWLRISLIGIPISTILIFAIPVGLPMGWKIAWACVAYLLWDMAYTICDVPIFGLVTTMTDIQQERISLNAAARVCAMIASMLVMVIIPAFRTAMGGWTSSVVMLSIVAVITMLPICLTAKERVAPTEGAKEDVSLKDMFRYLKGNKFLLIYYVSYMIIGATNITSSWGLYLARYCLGDEAMMSVTNIIGFVPIILLGMVTPALLKKTDKFKFYYIATAATLVINVLRYFVGYHNVVAYLVMTVLIAIPTAFTQVMAFMFTPDCAEYGQYKNGTNYAGITFATQTFFVKLKSSVLTSFASFALVFIGFAEGEGAEQAEGFADKLWAVSCFAPAAGILIALLLLRLYKLNDHDVQLMAKCNAGEITKDEAQAQMINNY